MKFPGKQMLTDKLSEPIGKVTALAGLAFLTAFIALVLTITQMMHGDKS